MGDQWRNEILEVERRRRAAAALGGAVKIQRQHDAGRRTVSERIAELLDAGSFEQIGALAGFQDVHDRITPTNFVFGAGLISGRRVVIGADDFTVRGGAADASIAQKQIDSERFAHEYRMPLVRLIEGTGGGGSVRTLEEAGHTYVPVNPGWDAVVANLSTVPVVAACLGPVAGLGAARAVMSHFSILVENTAQLFVAGPPVVKHATGEQLTKEELGGAEVHERSGAIDRVVPDEGTALELTRRFLSYLPQSVFELPPREAANPPALEPEILSSVVPRNRRAPYRLQDIVEAVFDGGSVMEYSGYSGSLFTGLARLNGYAVGVVGTDPYRGATMTPHGADALVRFVDLCETFHLPLVSLTDQSGMQIGREAESAASIRRGARAVTAVYQARIPMAEVIVRRVFGVGGAGQVNRHRFNRQWAWPSGDWGSLPVEGGIEAAYRAELEGAESPQERLDEIRQKLEAVRSPFRTAVRYGVQDIIDPSETRGVLLQWVDDAYRLLPELIGRPHFGTRP